MINTEQFAAHLYQIYCAAVGGFDFNGDPLPDWETFRSDPNKSAQSQAWIAVAQAAVNPPASKETSMSQPTENP